MSAHELVGKFVTITGAARACDQKHVGRTVKVLKAISRHWVEVSLNPYDKMGIADKNLVWETKFLELAPGTLESPAEQMAREIDRQVIDSMFRDVCAEEDAELIKTVSNAPDKEILHIDVRERKPAHSLPNTLERLKAAKNHIRKVYDNKWNPLAFDEDINIPVRSAEKDTAIQLVSEPCHTHVIPEDTAGVRQATAKLKGAREERTARQEAATRLGKLAQAKKTLAEELREIDAKYDATIEQIRTESWARRGRQKRQAEDRARLLENNRTSELLDKYLQKEPETVDLTVRRFSWTRAGLAVAIVGALGAAAWYLPAIFWG